jgi:DNA polymerase III subunit delta
LSLKQFQQESEKGFPSPIYLFYSTEGYLLYEALNVVRGLFQDPALFSLEIIDLASSDEKLPVEKIIDILNTLPFLSSKKTVVIRNAQKWTKKEAQKFGAYLKNPADSSLLIILYEGKAPDIFDAALMKGVKTIALNVAEREIPAWIAEKAAGGNIRFSPEAIEYIITFVGTDLGMLHAEIGKFGQSETGRLVDLDEVRGVIYAGAEYGAFDLTTALAQKDAKQVFRIYEKLGRAMEPQMLLGALNWQYASSGSRGTIPGMDRKKLEKVYALLHEADMAVKRSHSHVIEDLLAKLLKI